MMKISIIGYNSIPSREGNADIAIGELSRHMAARGHRITVCNRLNENEKPNEYDGVTVRGLKTRGSSALSRLLYSLRATLKMTSCDADIIHFYTGEQCVFIPLVRLFRKKAVVSIHSLEQRRARPGSFAAKCILKGERNAVRYADAIIVSSTNIQNYFRRTYDCPTELVPNGVNPPKIKTAQIIKEKYGLTDNEFILFAASIAPGSGLNYLIDAFSALKTDKKLVVAGALKSETAYVKEIKKKAALDSRVLFTGAVVGDELAELYSSCFCYVQPADTGEVPANLLEAASCHAPCVVSDTPENMEILGESAHTFKSGDAVSLGNQLFTLLKNEEYKKQNFRPELSEQDYCSAIEKIIAVHDWDDATDKVLELYDDIINGDKDDLDDSESEASDDDIVYFDHTDDD